MDVSSLPFVFMLAPIVIVIVFIYFIFRVISAQNRSFQMGLPGQNAFAAINSPRIVADGFWIYSDAIMNGATIQYRYRIDGSWQEGSVAYAPGPQGVFVYTGSTPDEVAVYRVTSSTSQVLFQSDDDDMDTDDSDNYQTAATTDTSSGFSGFPSAY